MLGSISPQEALRCGDPQREGEELIYITHHPRVRFGGRGVVNVDHTMTNLVYVCACSAYGVDIGVENWCEES